MMDPISIAFGLAQFAPAIVKWITGNDQAAEAAGKVVDIAKIVTGKDEPAEALNAVQADPAIAMQFRKAIMANETELDKAYLADRKDARARDVEFIRAGRENKRADIMLLMAFVAVIIIATLLAMGKVDGSEAVGGFLITIGGMFARNIGTAFDFEFGSSRGSKDKTDMLAGNKGN